MNNSISRRHFIRNSTLVIASACQLETIDHTENPKIKVGLITDIHHADKDPKGTRHYRDSLSKLRKAVSHFQKAKPDFVVELGDLIDSAENLQQEINFLKEAEAVYKTVPCPRHYVLGNHCVSRLTKKEFFTHTGATTGYKSFDKNGFHFVILDACHRSKDGVDYQRGNFQWTDSFIPKKQLEWLKDDLNKNKKPTIVMIHQRLDPTKHHTVKNADTIRKILEQSGQVQLVLQGHSHKNQLVKLNNIYYCVLRATIEQAGIENSAYAVLNLYESGKIEIEGFGKQNSVKSNELQV